jgi:hypothetical protein
VTVTATKDQERLAILDDAVSAAGGWSVLRKTRVMQTIQRHNGERLHVCYTITLPSAR